MFWKYTRNETKVLLNVTLILFAAFALFVGKSWSVVVTEEKNLSANTVGVFAGVEENEINTLVAKLDQREKDLDARELALVKTNSLSNRNVVLGMMIVGVALFGLILLNFYLDSKRRMSLVE